MPSGARNGHPIRVGFQGEPGAFSEAAILAFWGAGGAEPIPYPTFADVFERLEEGAVDVAMVPVENSYAGDVGEVYDLFRRHAIRIRAELQLPVLHCLLAMPGATLAGLRVVRSHPQALAQCREFLRRHALVAEPVHDTAAAARQVAEAARTDLAAIASREAARRHGLQILAEDIQDAADNVTRFYVIEREASREDGGKIASESAAGPLVPSSGNATPGVAGPSGEPHTSGESGTSGDGSTVPGIEEVSPQADQGMLRVPASRAPVKTSLIFVGEDRPGALYHCLGAFAKRNINLTKLTARPERGRSWQYMFFADLEGSVEEPAVAEALAELRHRATFVRVLGSYPVYRAVSPQPRSSP
ncbi:MAG TPA: prephenate dehydratase [Thermaerobacter sp.]